jgi:hypothetical protein
MGMGMEMGIPASPRELPPIADVSSLNAVVGSSLLLMDTVTQSALSAKIPKSTWLDLPATGDACLSLQAHRLIGATGQYLDEISVRYFQGIHNFIPIISRTRFHAQLMSSGSVRRRTSPSCCLSSVCSRTILS